MAKTPGKKALSGDLEAARSHLAGYITALRHDTDVGSRVKASVRGNPILWFAGAAVIGFALSQIPARRRKVVIKGPKVANNQAETAGKAAFGLTALKFGLDLAKPTIVNWLKKYVSSISHPRSGKTA